MYQSDGKKKVWHSSSSVKHGGGGVMARARMAATGIVLYL